MWPLRLSRRKELTIGSAKARGFRCVRRLLSAGPAGHGDLGFEPELEARGGCPGRRRSRGERAGRRRSRGERAGSCAKSRSAMTTTRPPTSVGEGGKKVVKPHDRLVPVSSMHCCTSTSGLSTTSSAWGLQEAEASGTPYLGGGFPLRCFQRLSLPNIATRLCGWRHNRSTRGSSIPVLSY